MSATATVTPQLSGLRVAHEAFWHGLQTDGLLVRGIEGEDIARFRFNRRTTYVLRHPDYVDHVLHEGTRRYHKSIEYEILRAVLGLSLFTDEDESWLRHRMMINPVLAKRHLTSLYELMLEPIARYGDELERAGDGIELDMTREMTGLTLDVVGTALFGRGMSDFARGVGRTVTAGLRAAERASRLILVANPPAWSARALVASIRHAPVLPPPLDRLQHVMRTIDGTVWDVVEQRRRSPHQADDLLGLLLSVRDEENRELPIRRVRDEVATFMLAGHETTANALSWTWYLLALHHGARERMLVEVDEVLGDRTPTFEDVGRLYWTAACFQEAMRMFSPAWVIPRVCVEEDTIDGHRIEKGASVIIPINSLHHDPRFWPRPESFDPTRFMPENAHSHHRSSYLPFGGGRRICVGKSFAMIEGALVLAAMSRHFVYELVPGHPVEPEATLTLRPRHGLKMIARRRVDAHQAVAA